MQSSNFADLALSYADRGWSVFPLQPRDKRPLSGSRGFKDATTDRQRIIDWWAIYPDANIGLATGAASGLVVVDVDAGTKTDGTHKKGLESFNLLKRTLPDFADTLTVRTGGGGLHLYYANSGSLGSGANSLGEKYPDIDHRGDGGYVVAPGSIHQNGTPYEWVDETVAVTPLPASLETLLGDLRKRSESHGTSISSVLAEDGFFPTIPEGRRNDMLASIAGRMRRSGLSEDAIEAALQAENLKICKPPLRMSEVAAIARSIGRYAPAPNKRFTDLGAAEWFVEFFGEDVRYQIDADRWLVWCGTHWKPDGKRGNGIQHRVSQLGAKLIAEADKGTNPKYSDDLRKFSNSIESRARIRAITDLVATLPTIQVRAADLDSDLWSLNFQNGTLDLRTQAIVPHDRKHLITTVINFDYDPSMEAPRFQQFLNEIFPDAPGIRNYLQKYLGYSLTGAISDQSLLVATGHGANGKSVLAAAIKGAMGEYAGEASPETFASRPAGGTRGDIVRLRGMRLVVSSETNEGVSWDEAMLKRLTGGEPVVARKLYQEEETFLPTFKALFLTNNTPRFTADDAAIWRRLRLIPFKRVFNESERDELLPSKLAAERAGIMAWLVEGCRLWQQEGLSQPVEMVEARDDHRAALDDVGAFLEGSCQMGGGATAKTNELYRAYTGWVASECRHPEPQRRFSTILKRKGFTSRKSNGIMVWEGLKLIPGMSIAGRT
jgi:putative DNA primase/helicase